MIRTIIAGSRAGVTLDIVRTAVKISGWKPDIVLSGTARGTDKLGETVAKELNIPVELFPANWDLHGKSAGYKRNITMGENADSLIAVWDGESRGTKHMIEIATKLGLRVFVHKFTEPITNTWTNPE